MKTAAHRLSRRLCCERRLTCWRPVWQRWVAWRDVVPVDMTVRDGTTTDRSPSRWPDSHQLTPSRRRVHSRLRSDTTTTVIDATDVVPTTKVARCIHLGRHIQISSRNKPGIFRFRIWFHLLRIERRGSGDKAAIAESNLIQHKLSNFPLAFYSNN